MLIPSDLRYITTVRTKKLSLLIRAEYGRVDDALSNAFCTISIHLTISQLSRYKGPKFFMQDERSRGTMHKLFPESAYALIDLPQLTAQVDSKCERENSIKSD